MDQKRSYAILPNEYFFLFRLYNLHHHYYQKDISRNLVNRGIHSYAILGQLPVPTHMLVHVCAESLLSIVQHGIGQHQLWIPLLIFTYIDICICFISLPFFYFWFERHRWCTHFSALKVQFSHFFLNFLGGILPYHHLARILALNTN